MKATARMKEGLECGLIPALAAHTEFGMTEEEINNVLDPSLYTGRCGEQVQRYVEKLSPVLAQATDMESEISL